MATLESSFQIASEQPLEDRERIDKNPPKSVGVDFNPKAMSMKLDLHDESIDPDLSERLKKIGFEPKDALHLTAISFKNGNKLAKALKKMSETERPAAIDTIRAFAESSEWNIIPTGEFFAIEK